MVDKPHIPSLDGLFEDGIQLDLKKQMRPGYRTRSVGPLEKEWRNLPQEEREELGRKAAYCRSHLPGSPCISEMSRRTGIQLLKIWRFEHGKFIGSQLPEILNAYGIKNLEELHHEPESIAKTWNAFTQQQREDIGKAFRDVRKSRGILQRDLSKNIHFSHLVILRLEGGKHVSPLVVDGALNALGCNNLSELLDAAEQVRRQATDAKEIKNDKNSNPKPLGKDNAEKTIRINEAHQPQPHASTCTPNSADMPNVTNEDHITAGRIRNEKNKYLLEEAYRHRKRSSHVAIDMTDRCMSDMSISEIIKMGKKVQRHGHEDRQDVNLKHSHLDGLKRSKDFPER